MWSDVVAIGWHCDLDWDLGLHWSCWSENFSCGPSVRAEFSWGGRASSSPGCRSSISRRTPDQHTERPPCPWAHSTSRKPVPGPPSSPSRSRPGLQPSNNLGPRGRGAVEEAFFPPLALALQLLQHHSCKEVRFSYGFSIRLCFSLYSYKSLMPSGTSAFFQSSPWHFIWAHRRS